MKKICFLVLLLPALAGHGQKFLRYSVKKQTSFTKDTVAQMATDPNTEILLEKPVNVFASAGPAVKLSTTYDVAVSPADNTVQFQKNSPVTSGVSFGLVWTPFAAYHAAQQTIATDTDGKTVKTTVAVPRSNFAMALLVNVFQLSFTQSQSTTSTPIDVGLGIGLRKDNFLVLATLEFMKTSQPRQYFIDQYMDKNKVLIPAGGTDPVHTINPSDNSLFTTTLIPAIGLKVAYSFSRSPAKASTTSAD